MLQIESEVIEQFKQKITKTVNQEKNNCISDRQSEFNQMEHKERKTTKNNCEE